MVVLVASPQRHPGAGAVREPPRQCLCVALVPTPVLPMAGTGPINAPGGAGDDGRSARLCSTTASARSMECAAATLCPAPTVSSWTYFLLGDTLYFRFLLPACPGGDEPPVLCADRSRARGRMGRIESKGRERLPRPRPVHRIQKGSAWRRHGSGHEHGHPAHADRCKRVRHDRRVAQPDHRKNPSPMLFARLGSDSTIIPHGTGVVNAQEGKSWELSVGWTVVVMGSWPFVWLPPPESLMTGLTRSPWRRRAIIGEPAEAGLVSLSPRLQPPGVRDDHGPM